LNPKLIKTYNKQIVCTVDKEDTSWKPRVGDLKE
jgi:hypothetical protein